MTYVVMLRDRAARHEWATRQRFFTQWGAERVAARLRADHPRLMITVEIPDTKVLW